MTQEIIHVGIKEPKQKRKEILNLSIDIIQLLKKYEKFKKIEREKNIYRTHLVKNIKRLTLELKRFEAMLPKIKEAEPKKEIPVPRPPKLAKTKAVKKTKKKTVKKKVKKNEHLSKLESDIASLKSKISSL